VTVPSSAYSAGEVRYEDENWHTIQSLTFNSTGAPLNLFFSMDWYASSFDGSSARDVVASVSAEARILRDGSTIFSVGLGSARRDVDEGDTESVEIEGYLTLPYLDMPPARNITYKLQIRANLERDFGVYDGHVKASKRSLIALETKR